MRHNRPINVLIVDDDAEICYLMSKFLSSVEDIKVCGISSSGSDALNKIHSMEPDIVLLDIMMPRIDGIGVLMKLNNNPPTKMPRIIMTTAMAKEAVIKKAMDLGACYYVVKPCDFDSLLNSIYMVADSKEEDLLSSDIRDSKRERMIITKMMVDLGVPSHILGYKYISYGLYIMLTSDSFKGTIESLYLIIGEHYSNTSQCIESSIRNAISKTEKNKTDTYIELFGKPGSEGYKKPTNTSFINKISQYIELKYN